jgi:competence ComEA-like helix-hairpin-helix protein
MYLKEHPMMKRLFLCFVPTLSVFLIGLACPVIAVAEQEIGGPSMSYTPSQSSQGRQVPSEKVNVNTATAEELANLPGMGPETAQAIVKDRESKGPFKSFNDLIRVPGLGAYRLQKIRQRITLE